MSRSGYIDDPEENWSHIMWRGAVASAIRGARGQAMLRELLAALDAMPEKRLIAHELESEGQYCTLGVLGAKRGISMGDLDPEAPEEVAAAFGVARALVQEIVYMNDEACCWQADSPESRWTRMREWVAAQIRNTTSTEGTQS